MKNWEKYEKEIREIGYTSIAVVDGKPRKCGGVNCSNCDLSSDYNNGTACSRNLIKWLYQDADEIRVGDVVQNILTGRKAYVTRLSAVHFEGFSISEDNLGESYNVVCKDKWKKTGKHIPLYKVIELIGGTK